MSPLTPLIVSLQDTLLTNQGSQVYLRSIIQGATDFIFGQYSAYSTIRTRLVLDTRLWKGRAYFEGNTIAVSSYGCITASGRWSDDSGICAFRLVATFRLRYDGICWARSVQQEHGCART